VIITVLSWIAAVALFGSLAVAFVVFLWLTRNL
jgi:hypothetical protein